MSVSAFVALPRAQTNPEFPREVLDLPCQIAHRAKPGPRLLRAEAMPEISVALALIGYSWNRVTYDDPIVEKVEEAMEGYRGGLDERAMRFLIRELLVSGSANSSFWRFELQAALYALNLGKVNDLVKPTQGRRQGDPIQLRSWKAAALDHV